MKHIFWLEQGKIAGRAGPDSNPWNAAELKDAGFTAVLSVNDGRFCHPEDFQRLDMVYHCLPLTDKAPPHPGDLEKCVSILPKAADFVSSQVDQGGTMLIHCTSGKDRTGMLMAYLLIRRQGMAVREAMEAVRQVRKIAFSAEGWERFTYDVLSRLCIDRH